MSGVKFYSPTIDDIFIEIRFAKVSKSSRFGGYREFSDSMPRKLQRVGDPEPHGPKRYPGAAADGSLLQDFPRERVSFHSEFLEIAE